MPDTSPEQILPIIVMGVSGCGKTMVGSKLAKRLKWEFIDGDKLHPISNIQKMKTGTPLTDDDRWPWLEKIAYQMGEHKTQEDQIRAHKIVVACSALRQTYRQYLRDQIKGPIRFIHLHGSKEIIAQRLSARQNHFMPPHLLDSQFATLEAPGQDENVISINIDQPVDTILNNAISALKSDTII